MVRSVNPLQVFGREIWLKVHGGPARLRAMSLTGRMWRIT